MPPIGSHGEPPFGEDCLTLNVWTRGLDGAKRPVMVWYHGGGFGYGSANSPRLDGTNLATHHDVVVVTVNQRLNILGHMHLAEFGGAAFAQSGNAGALDMLASLQWVRDNIARFGGDPGNVTIFGQSGGGGKVSTLLAMPAAPPRHRDERVGHPAHRSRARRKARRGGNGRTRPRAHATRRAADAALQAPDRSHRTGGEKGRPVVLAAVRSL
jgi:para-nitrobenzyl esterase